MYTIQRGCSLKESFTLDYHNGLDVSRGENPSPLLSCEWSIGDRGDLLLLLTPLPLSSFR